MAKTVSKWVGLVLIVVGLAGFAMPTLMGAHLSPVHNVIHLVSGALALWFGTRGSLHGARAFAVTFGAVYLLLGVAGFVAGTGGTGHDASLLRVIPGTLELGFVDHVIHVMLGGLFLAAGIGTATQPRHAS